MAKSGAASAGGGGGDWELLDSSEVFIELQGVANLPRNIDAAECVLAKPDTEKPLLKLGSFVYSGRYEDTVGTYLAFRLAEPPARQQSVLPTESRSGSGGAGGGAEASTEGDDQVQAASGSDNSNSLPSLAEGAGLSPHQVTNGKLQFIGKTDKLLRMMPACVRTKATNSTTTTTTTTASMTNSSSSSNPGDNSRDEPPVGQQQQQQQ